MEYLNEYQPLPLFLLDAVNVASSVANGMQRSGCIGDVTAEDCNQDSACTSDGVCSSDKPCSDCSDNPTPCSDCSDKPSYTAPSFSVDNITDAGFRVSVSTVGWTTQYRVFVRYSNDSTSSVFDQLYTKASSFAVTVSALEPNTKYTVNVCAFTSATVSAWAGAQTVTTKQAFTRFDWTYAGQLEDGTLVIGNEKTVGLGIYITADEWNELAGLIQSTTGSSVSTTTPGSYITAAVVNTAARALGVSTVTKDVTEISASFFNRLRNAYNNLAPT